MATNQNNYTKDKQKPGISSALLWEFNMENFDFQKSAFIVIERVIQRGNLDDWKEIFNCYGEDAIPEVAQKSKQLSIKGKHFSGIFVYSELLHAA